MSDSDVVPLTRPLVWATEEDKTNKEKMNNLIYDFVQNIRPFIQSWEKRYINHGSKKYYLGDYLSLADFWMVHMTYHLTIDLFPESGIILSKEFNVLYDYLNNIVKEDVFQNFINGDDYIKGKL